MLEEIQSFLTRLIVCGYEKIGYPTRDHRHRFVFLQTMSNIAFDDTKFFKYF